MRGTSNARWLLELDGITVMQAAEVNGLSFEHTPFELEESNRPMPRLGRGNYKVNEVTIKHGTFLNGTGSEFWTWLSDFARGINIERRTFRFIRLDETGDTPVENWECYDCVPTKFQPENGKALDNAAAYFSLSLRPEDLEYFE